MPNRRLESRRGYFAHRPVGTGAEGLSTEPNPSHQQRGNVPVSVACMALNPSFRNCRINPALEIAVSDFEELVTPQYPAHGNL